MVTIPISEEYSQKLSQLTAKINTEDADRANELTRRLQGLSKAELYAVLDGKSKIAAFSKYNQTKPKTDVKKN